MRRSRNSRKLYNGAAMVAHWHSLLQPECDVVVEAQARLASDRATGTPHTLEHHIMLPE